MTRNNLKDVIKQLGRYGKPPWQKKRYDRELCYIDSTTVALMPISHMLLHGPLKDYWRMGLWSIFTSSQLKDVDDMDDRICLPHCHCRTYQNIRLHIGNYKIEELANLICFGGIFVELGPPRFQKLWCSLRPALNHYMYGRDECTEELIDNGHKHLWEYAAGLERGVLAGWVCSYQTHARRFHDSEHIVCIGSIKYAQAKPTHCTMHAAPAGGALQCSCHFQ